MPFSTSLQRGMVSAQAPHFNTPLLPEFWRTTGKSFPGLMSHQASITFTEKMLVQIPEDQIPKRGQPLGPCTLSFPHGHQMIPALGYEWTVGVGKEQFLQRLSPTTHLSLTLGLCPDLSYRSPAQEDRAYLLESKSGTREASSSAVP